MDDLQRNSEQENVQRLSGFIPVRVKQPEMEVYLYIGS